MEINKQHIYETCSEILTVKEKELKKLIAATRESNNDTKSSMGDKYETSREMLQQEINMLEKQLAEIIDQQQVLKRIKISVSKFVNLGAIVKLELGMFFIAVGMGEIKANNQSLMTISANSPLAKAMFGKTAGDSFMMNNKSYKIDGIL